MWDIVVGPMLKGPRPAAAAWYPLMLRVNSLGIVRGLQIFFLLGKTVAPVNPENIVNQ